MKAYRHEDGSIWSFRPEENAARMVRSSHRLALPVLEVEDFVQAVDALVDRRPALGARNATDAGEKSLYVRPFMFASEAFLGVRPAQHVTFMVIASPAGAYFKGGVKPVTPLAHRRSTPAPAAAAWARPRPAATTPARCSPQPRPSSQGCDQVVFLDGEEGRYVEELGGMNMYFVLKRRPDRHARPSAPSSRASPGPRSSSWPARWATRSRSGGSRSTSGATASTSGDIVEIFACGTAAVVTPVGELSGRAARRPRPASTDLTMRDPQGAGRRAVRPRRGHLRLDAPDRLTRGSVTVGPWAPNTSCERSSRSIAVRPADADRL